MKPGWRIFLRVLSFGLYAGAKAARKPTVREQLENAADMTGELVDESEPVTPPASPKAKREHKGVR